MPVNMAAGLSVNISVEQLLESEVEEITRDGQEKYVPQLSMSEQLTKFANKIDFQSEDKSQKNREDDDEQEEKALVTFQPSLWPWDSVRSKLRNALTEVCVLSDILNVVQDKKYMVLDPVTQNQATPKPVVQLLAKRKNLSSAADIILQGTKRMESAVQERVEQQLKQGQRQEDFHSELIGLRQRWRLKKTGTSIMGDLTYRSAGSQFWNPGLFEVTKGTKTEEEESQTNQTNDSSSLEVNVGSDLEGVASVTVSICESGTKQDGIEGKPRIAKVIAKVHDSSNTPLWQQKLQSAQENIFCKELFTQLCQEAYNSRGPNINLVMGQEIKTEVFPGVNLCITYTHEKDTNQTEMSTGATAKDLHDQPVATTLKPLEYALHSLLRRRHKHNQSVVLPHPVTARQLPGTNKRLRIAGPAALRANEVTSSLESETILETIIKVSKHEILRKRVMEMIDNLTAELSEPCILCHWSSVSSETCTSAVVHIYSPEIQDIGKVSFRLQIGIKDINVICSTGTSITFTSHLQDLKDFFLTQIAQHRILIAYSIALSLGWQVLHINRHLPTGTTENQGHVAGMVVTSSDAERTIAIRTGPSTGVTVYIKKPHKYTSTVPEFLTDKKWTLVGGSFKQVAWDEMPGRTFVQKVSLLLGIENKKS